MRALSDTLTIWRKDMLVWVKEPGIGIIRAIFYPLVWMIIFANSFGGPSTTFLSRS